MCDSTSFPSLEQLFDPDYQRQLRGEIAVCSRILKHYQEYKKVTHLMTLPNGDTLANKDIRQRLLTALQSVPSEKQVSDRLKTLKSLQQTTHEAAICKTYRELQGQPSHWNP